MTATFSFYTIYIPLTIFNIKLLIRIQSNICIGLLKELNYGAIIIMLIIEYNWTGLYPATPGLLSILCYNRPSKREN